MYDSIDFNFMLQNLLPKEVKIDITIYDVGLKSNLKINQTLIFTTKSFFYTILGFTQSHSYPLDDIHGFYQILPSSYKSDKPNNITGFDKVHLNVIL